ncbi:hypothetical protein F441_16475 [Phytophthora nicotianae CJ01A1]|uniref:VWFD domain-containing protein n=2 Tax=Phytophthora nicotianae TaxID=4792 RepID=W2I9Z6_PHYNI|nr:hypothetical protein L916_16073 [Phytophthora nicotianae]ETL31016.1 hypothetical protein L916_16072 [Phytophthora nicotianae]ETP07202.1 hypothetical protein F441_16475 [Phytophthora nicotianae CJ01A1]
MLPMHVSERFPLATILVLFIALAMTATTDSKPTKTLATTSHQSLSDASSVRLQIMLTGRNMQIHGQSVFDVFAKPTLFTDGTRIRYDGFATFIQGDSQFTYMVVDGSAYVVENTGDDTTPIATQTVNCLPSITPFDSIIDALNNLTAITNDSIGDDSEMDCSTRDLYETSFGGEHFKVCPFGADGFIAYGGDITMTVEYLDGPLRSFSAPKLTNGNKSCPVVAKPTTASKTTLTLLNSREVSPISMDSVADSD